MLSQTFPLLPRELFLFPEFSDLSEGELACLSEGQELVLADSDVLIRQGDPPAQFFIVLSGAIDATHRVDQREIPFMTFPAGTFFGHELLLLDMPFAATGSAVGVTRIWQLDAEAFWQLVGHSPSLRRLLLRTTAMRVQMLEATSQQQARLTALESLAAGLAHELNNPVSAIRSAAAALPRAISQTLDAAHRLSHLPDVVVAWRRQSASWPQPTESALDRMDRHDALALALKECNLPDTAALLPQLTDAGLTPARVREFAASIGDEPLYAALQWLHAAVSLDALAWELQQAGRRVTDVVGAMKAYTHLDRAPGVDVCVNEGLENTLTVMKARLGHITVVKQYWAGLPLIIGDPAELNQIWTHLVDNAVNAMDGAGTLTLRTWCDQGQVVVVEIADTGCGIPIELQPRLFEPFFTTHRVGQGRGLGLLTVRRLVHGHQGEVRMQSCPGDTRFQVRLPVRTLAANG